MSKIIKPGLTIMFIVGAWSKPNIRYQKEFRAIRICLGFIFIEISARDFTAWYNKLLKEYLKLADASDESV